MFITCKMSYVCATLLLGWVQSIAISMPLSLSSAHISEKSHVRTSRNFLCMLAVAVAQYSSDDNVICCMLPVLWMTSFFHIIGQHICSVQWGLRLRDVSQREAMQRATELQLHPSALPPTDWHLSAVSLNVRSAVWLRKWTTHCA